jgi:hypothetical protein
MQSRVKTLSVIQATSYATTHDRHTDRRWTKVALAFLLLLGATVVAAQESHSNTAPQSQQTTNQY